MGFLAKSMSTPSDILANWRGKFPVLLCKIKEIHQGKGVIIMKITIEQIPDTFEKFEEMADTQRTPELVCVLFLCALALFIRNREDGIAAMNLLRGPRPMQPMDSQFLQDRLRGKAYLPFAYYEGAAPRNNYQPGIPYVLSIQEDPRPQDIEPGYLRLFLKTAGADSPRPIKLRKKESTVEWFLWEYSSILSGIQMPVSEDPWA